MFFITAFIAVVLSACMTSATPESRRWPFTYYLEPTVPTESDSADDDRVDIFDSSFALSDVDNQSSH